MKKYKIIAQKGEDAREADIEVRSSIQAVARIFAKHGWKIVYCIPLINYPNTEFVELGRLKRHENII